MYSFIFFKVLADKMFTIFTTLCAVGVVMPTTAVIISHPLQILAFWIVKYSNESLLWDYILISIRYVFVYRAWTQWYEILKKYSLVINTTFDFIWSSCSHCYDYGRREWFIRGCLWILVSSNMILFGVNAII